MSEALRLPLAFVGEDAPDRERDLVARLRAGELAALGEAYDAHHAHLRAFARRLLGDEAAAEDLVQETFLALRSAIVRFREEASLRTFLLSVAVRRARHHVRAAARRRAAHERFGREPLSTSSMPDHDAERAQLAERLLRTMDTLPVEQRVVVVLCEVEERTSREAALIVGVPDATVRTRLFHAKRKLGEALDKEGVR
jgi:RNA polymerase sigma-70 factor (ECF subfamily)